MEGYLHLRINPILRRILTRLLAVVPAVVVILVFGEKEVGSLLIFSQVILSMQLAFAVIPLIHFVSDKGKMGNFTINTTTKFFAWTIAFIISFLNAQLVYEEFGKWMAQKRSYSLNMLLVGLEIGLLVLLLLTFFIPIFLKKKKEQDKEIHEPFESFTLEEISKQHFERIVVALDFSKTDKKVINYATQLATPQSKLILVHVVESASVKYTGEKTNDAEAKSDLKRLEQYAEILRPLFHETKIELGYNNRVETIAKICQDHHADLIIVGSHGHRGFMDFIFGETINKLRHRVNIPVFIAK